MRELGITPIFPPRQDVRIGQIYLQLVEPKKWRPNFDKGFLQMGTYFAALDLNDQLKKYYSERADFAVSSASAPSRLSLVSTSGLTYVDLKPVAFPGFLKATARGADIGALVPVSGLPLKAGLSFSSVESASVTVSAAESYSLPWLQVANKLHATDGSIDLGIDAAKRMAALIDQTPKDTSIELTVISEVFYARSFDTTFHLSSSAALALSQDIKAEKAAVEAAKSTQLKSTATGVDGPMAVASAASDAAGLAAAEIRKKAVAYDNAVNLVPQLPGVSLGVAYSATGDIGLRRTYDQPIAIGYRGLTFKVKVKNGRILLDELVSSPDKDLVFIINKKL